MWAEVNPDVRNVIENIRLSSPYRSVTEVVVAAGVPFHEAREQASEYAWRLPGDQYLLTIWGEFVHVHQSSGRWFYIESLDIEFRFGGALRGPLQLPRAAFRRDCLRRIYERGSDAAAALQVNRLSIAQLEENKDAVVSVRVKDSQRWHVADWDTEAQRVVLVRGNHDWAPTKEEIVVAIAGRPALDADASLNDGARMVWPNQAHRDAIEGASVGFVTRAYEDQGLVVEDVSKKNLGYDLVIRGKPDGDVLFHLEVKGTSLLSESFYLTRNERAASQKLLTWRLVIVSNVLQSPAMKIYPAADMETNFLFDALVWRATKK